MGLHNELVFTEAIEQVEALCASQNSDEIGTRIEQIAGIPDLAQACLMLLLFKVHGVDTKELNGISLANPKFGIADLVLPPGVEL